MAHDLKDAASRAAADWRMRNGCIHVLSCKCWQRFRMVGWLTADALIDAGWTLTPPTTERADYQ